MATQKKVLTLQINTALSPNTSLSQYLTNTGRQQGTVEMRNIFWFQTILHIGLPNQTVKCLCDIHQVWCSSSVSALRMA